MSPQSPPQVEDRIARCRLILSTVAIVAVFADPTKPFVAGWIPLSSGGFTIDPWVLAVMGTHFVYSVLVYLAAVKHWVRPERLAAGTQWADVVLGAAIAFLTEGITSPFYPFFAFAVVVAGFRSGLRQALLVTAVSVGLYLAMIVISAPGNLNIYIMRPAYLAIVGYLVGYLGQQRLILHEEIQALESAAQRHRIARDLHDGFAQSLAGINLRIESCRRLLRRNDAAEALDELTDLQGSVNREYDDLRAYMMSLAGIRPSPATVVPHRDTRFSLTVRVDGTTDLVDHVLQIAREGLSNVRRHSGAANARIEVTSESHEVRITIEDDGVGLESPTAPWSIASRVRELGGQIEVPGVSGPGSRLNILLPLLPQT